METDKPKKTLLIGSSILQGVNTNGLGKHVQVKTVGGAKIADIENIIKKDNNSYDSIVLQVGTNDHEKQIPVIMDHYGKLVDSIHANSSQAEIIVSALTPRMCSAYAERKIKTINQELKKLSKEKDVNFVQHPNLYSGHDRIKRDLLVGDGLHLSKTGTSQHLRDIEKFLKTVPPIPYM